MKILIVLFLSLSLYANTKPIKFEATFGFLSGGTLLASFKDARIAVRAWLEDIAYKYDGKLDVKFYDTSEELYTDLKNNKIQMAVLDLPFFFKNKKDIYENSSNFWSLTMNNTKFAQYYLITTKDSKYNGFKNIKDKKISLKEGNRVAYVWLDKNSLLSNKKSAINILNEIKYERKESTVLLNVFFKKTDFAIVSKKTWDTMVELNPTISKKLKIIDESKKIHYPFIGIFSKKASSGSVYAFFNLSSDIKNLEGSEQIISMLKFDHIFKIDETTLEPLEKYYNEYFELKRKYE